MKNQKEINKISRFLSLVLRHKPEEIALHLDNQGWANVEELLEKMNKYGMQVDRDTLDIVVETNNKKRFAFNADKNLIRASQGHSIKVDLNYQPAEPPFLLYHGTSTKYLGNILREGIMKRNRQHVHLSTDVATASQVGKRHGELVMLEVNAALMQKDGCVFFVSENGVWLTDYVAPGYFKVIE